MTPNTVRRTFHFRQASTVGTDGSEFISFHFQQNATQSIPAAFVIGREHRASDNFAE